ncbi:hypothetical protein ElyMa_005968400 [Elysia marginata]|uniref:Uncharacterized protein n=1 Tax=Elysia marginata TaxID=1093978 RepID=A0AAV4GCN3_9GAST|nr:hypothetical protein ElyMa_005968400 [Elysia marginata]
MMKDWLKLGRNHDKLRRSRNMLIRRDVLIIPTTTPRHLSRTLSGRWASSNQQITSQTGKIKKKMCTILRENGPSGTFQANLKIVDFLDVTFNFCTGLHKSYEKPNDRMTYTYRERN